MARNKRKRGFRPRKKGRTKTGKGGSFMNVSRGGIRL